MDMMLAMIPLRLHDVHAGLGAQFCAVTDQEAVARYGDLPAEHAALRDTVAVLDLSFRSRLCLTGSDRQRFLNGQVTNNVKDLEIGGGCYAALVTAKGKFESDLNIYRLEDELLLDFEPGLSARVTQRFEKFIIADDVQIVDAAPLCGLLSVQGPRAEAVVRQLDLEVPLPAQPFGLVRATSATLGEWHLVNQPRVGRVGFDLFAPWAAMGALFEKLLAGAKAAGGGPCGWEALEVARVEAGIPRYGVDMDESNLPPEAGVEGRAISYTKGCYIGQEVIARIRAYGQVTKTLCGLRLAEDLKVRPERGSKLFAGDKEVGYVTSAVFSPTLRAVVALGYVRREAIRRGDELRLRTTAGDTPVAIVDLPFATGGPLSK